MSLQPAIDQVWVECLRRGLDFSEGQGTWEPAEDGRGLHLEFAFPDGTVLKGYAPDGMVAFEAEPAAESETPASPDRLH